LRSSEVGLATRARELVGGRRALVIGLAREGLDLTRFLVSHGASVHVTDQKPAEQLNDALAQLAGADVTYQLGGHSAHDLDSVDVVFASPGVPPEHELLEAARARGIQISSLV
jgi:UDP-N-acetylmuramoylalanine-D-glutamate ligase